MYLIIKTSNFLTKEFIILNYYYSHYEFIIIKFCLLFILQVFVQECCHQK